jgi:hypothetical protein
MCFRLFMLFIREGLFIGFKTDSQNTVDPQHIYM